jgi:hypothetical protein
VGAPGPIRGFGARLFRVSAGCRFQVAPIDYPHGNRPGVTMDTSLNNRNA